MLRRKVVLKSHRDGQITGPAVRYPCKIGGTVNFDGHYWNREEMIESVNKLSNLRHRALDEGMLINFMYL